PRSNDRVIAWSRDGTQIAVGDAGRIVIIRLSDRSERVLPVAGGSVTSLVWTAKDAGIAYVEDGLSPAADPDARLIDLPPGTETALALPARDSPLTSSASSLIVSPDGTQLAWMENDRRCDANGCDNNFPTRFATFDRSGIHALDPGMSAFG